MVGLWKGDYENNIITLLLRDDDTFTASLPTGFDGKWSISGGRVKLKIEKVMGLDLKDAIAQVKKDNPERLPWLESPGDIEISEDRLIIKVNPPAGIKVAKDMYLGKRIEE